MKITISVNKLEMEGNRSRIVPIIDYIRTSTVFAKLNVNEKQLNHVIVE